MDQVWRDFPPDRQREATLALAAYGETPHAREVVRVQLAVLRLARGDMGMLIRFLDHAREDYRDVLMWSVQPPPKYGT